MTSLEELETEVFNLREALTHPIEVNKHGVDITVALEKYITSVDNRLRTLEDFILKRTEDTIKILCDL